MSVCEWFCRCIRLCCPTLWRTTPLTTSLKLYICLVLHGPNHKLRDPRTVQRIARDNQQSRLYRSFIVCEKVASHHRGGGSRTPRVCHMTLVSHGTWRVSCETCVT